MLWFIPFIPFLSLPSPHLTAPVTFVEHYMASCFESNFLRNLLLVHLYVVHIFLLPRYFKFKKLLCDILDASSILWNEVKYKEIKSTPAA